MAKIKKTKNIKQKLDMAEHTNRLRALSSNNNIVKKGLVYLLASSVIIALLWLLIKY